ncbi:MAG: lysophospholipase [Cyanothece sp. SIO2G6]|nr:lysophospholipase [Cyanothece sp. SIO2G6]
MSELCTLAASVVLQSQTPLPVTEACSQSTSQNTTNVQAQTWYPHDATRLAGLARGTMTQQMTQQTIVPEPTTAATALARLEFSLQHQERPRSTSQLFQQRWEALRSGQTYTRLPVNSFADRWRSSSQQPTYEAWLKLLGREARSMAHGQGNNRLTVMVGDSLSMWMPTEFMPRHGFWLNQAVSGETAAAMTKRSHLFKDTRPNVIHVMAGINDLKNGASDRDILMALQTLMRQFRQQHPDAKVVVHSILPTRLSHLPSDRIRTLNSYIAYVANREGTHFLDLQPYFTDNQGLLRQELTTDGLHLNYQGYALWQSIMHQVG